MAFYDDKYWLLSHIRNSFITTDDSGMCEMIMSRERKDVKKYLSHLNLYPCDDDSDSDDDGFSTKSDESDDIEMENNFGLRPRSNTIAHLDRIEHARRKAAKIKHVKWESRKESILKEEVIDMFAKKDLTKRNQEISNKSLLSERIKQYTNVPLNPYIEYAKFDGSEQINIAIRKYKIFLTMLPEEQRNYPMSISCIASAKIEDLIGLILLKYSTTHGDSSSKPVSHYGLYITEDDGEVDSDFPCLDPKESVAKFGFTCLGLVEHGEGSSKNVSFNNSISIAGSMEQSGRKRPHREKSKLDERKQISNDLQLMEGHNKAMQAPLYQSYRVYLVNKVRVKVEIHLGISGEKIEIDPVQQKNFTFMKQKPVSHHMDTIAWCEIIDTRSSRSSFRLYYSSTIGSYKSAQLEVHFNGTAASYPPTLQTSASFKHYDFETDYTTAEEIVQKINLILELRSSASHKEYLAARERKHYKKKGFK